MQRFSFFKFLGITLASVEFDDDLSTYRYLGGFVKIISQRFLIKIYILSLRIFWIRRWETKLEKRLEKRFEKLVGEKTGEVAQIYRLASEINKKVFPKYKNCHVGRDIVLLASGPTMNYYFAIHNALHIGVNDSFLCGKSELDYLFAIDCVPGCIEIIRSYAGSHCKRFYGATLDVRRGIPDSYAEEDGAERFITIDPARFGCIWSIPPDISSMPLPCRNSIVFPAAQFALWTRPRRLFLVGCDCSNEGHAGGIEPRSNGINEKLILAEWRSFAQCALQLFPDTEIISINPVGLRGLFKDVYTQSFLQANPQTVQQIRQLSSQAPVLLDDIL